MFVRGSKGFTLIELLIVISIIVILAAVLIPNLLGARYRGQITAAVGELRSIATALETSALDTGVYPVNINETWRNIYLGGKNPRWWDGTNISASYSMAEAGANYTITSPNATGGLLTALRTMSGNPNAIRIVLTHDRGVVYVP